MNRGKAHAPRRASAAGRTQVADTDRSVRFIVLGDWDNDHDMPIGLQQDMPGVDAPADPTEWWIDDSGRQ